MAKELCLDQELGALTLAVALSTVDLSTALAVDLSRDCLFNSIEGCHSPLTAYLDRTLTTVPGIMILIRCEAVRCARSNFLATPTPLPGTPTRVFDTSTIE